MAEYIIQDTTLIEHADIIRNLSGLTTPLSFSEMNTVIRNAIALEDGFIDGSTEHISNHRITNIRDYAFYQHQTLIEANFSAATSIGDYSFYKCPMITSTNIPAVETVGAFSFKGCSSLTSANYPLAITVGQGCFDECTALSSVNLPLVTEVKPLTFRKCESLTVVDLPVAANIGTQAFYDSGITSLTLRSSTMVTLENEDAFYFTPIEEGAGNIYVPSNLVADYKSADGWSVYANQIKAIV